MKEEDRTFEKFLVMGYILGFISLLSAGYVYAFRIPNFSNLEEQRAFCFKYGGMPFEPSRQTYNEMICMFYLNDTYVEYVAGEINKEWLIEIYGNEWRNKSGLIDDYCFSCWDSRSCASPHNDVLREEGLHC